MSFGGPLQGLKGGEKVFFDSVKVTDYKNLLSNIDKIYAHIREKGNTFETISEHSDLSVKYFIKLV